MPLKRQIRNVSIRTKVLVPFILVLVVLMGATIYVVDRRFDQQTAASASHDLQVTGKLYRNYLAKHNEFLRRRYQSLANESAYKAALRTLDPNTVRDQLSRMVDMEGLANEGVKFVLFAAGETNVTASEPMIYQSDTSVSSHDILQGSQPVVGGALHGEVSSDTIRVGQKIYNLVSLPIYDVDGQNVIGALTFGEEIDWKSAQEFRLESNDGLTALIAGDHIVTSTLPKSESSAVIIDEFKKLTATSANTGPDKKNPPMIIDGQHYYAAADHYASLTGDTSLGYMLFSSYETELNTLHATRMLLLALGFVAILLGSVAVWWFVKWATQPLLELRASAEAVSRGDFTRRVTVGSNDEFGELALAFNQMMDHLQKSLSELEQTVQTLKSTQAQLVQSEKLSAVGEFVAGIAHELNNPLTAVMGFSELLQKADVDVKHRRYLEMIFKSSQRCQKIVQSLLSFARRQQPERKPVIINKLVEDILEIVGYHLRTSNIDMIVELDPNPPVIMVDVHQVQQVLLNIINNAMQAIEAHQPTGQIKISTIGSPTTLKLIIEDDGPGISKANLKKIFDPFFTTKEVGKGTGLGLSLCYGLIKEHGGTITATSEIGAGARFVIELPVANVSAEEARPVRSPLLSRAVSNDGAGKKILVVDDEDMLLYMIRDELMNQGFAVKMALDGETALRLVKEEYFDMAFFDWKMPGLNGRQIYERLKGENSPLCDRVVFITGDVINEQMRQFLDAEKRLCLAKPFTLMELRTAIKSIIHG